MALTEAQKRNAEKNRKYWADREEEALKHYIKEEAEYDRQIQKIYKDMLDDIQTQINGFYGKYATKEGITLAEAKKRVKQLDIEAYERKAKRYVKDKDFSAKANEEMRLYNATMKINRLEMLKANIGLETIAGHDKLEKFMGNILKGRTEAELARQAGILGKTIHGNAKLAHTIPNASFHSGTFSDRIWQYQDLMRGDLEKLLTRGLIQGKNARALTADLRKYLIGDKNGKGATYNVERLMRTELARVQTEAQKQSFIRNGFTQYQFHTNSGCCAICQGLNGKVFNVDKMMPGDNAPPVHPHCRCSTSAYSDRKEYDEWLDFLEKGGTTEEWNKLKKQPGDKMATGNTSSNNWDGAVARAVTKAEKQEITDYAKQKGINIADLSKFDGDPSLLKAEIDTLSKLKASFPTGNKKITISVGHLGDADFAETNGNTIIFNAKALRNRATTEKNINRVEGEFASKKLEDIAAHEFGHIFSAKKGNIGIEISQKAYYNVFGKNMGIDEILEYLDSEVSQYSTTYYENGNNRVHKFDVKKYREVTPEIFAKNNSNANDFTKEFIKLLKEV
jgi:SPP1 gp7 family putative phage head morphogenesis protein